MTTIPLTPEQRSLLFNDRLLGPGVAHNISFHIPLSSDIPDDVVRAAATTLTTRHGALRSGLVDAATQRLGNAEVDVAVFETDDLDEGLSLRYRQLHNAELFPRTTPRRAHFELVRSPAEQALLVSLDHVAADGFSVDLAQDCLSGALGLTDDPGAPAVSFEAFCTDRAAVAERRRNREIAAWQQAFDGVEPVLGLLPHEGERATWIRAQRDSVLPGGELTAAVRELAATTRSTPFIVVAALVSAVIWQRTGQRAFAVQTPVSTRRAATDLSVISYLVSERPIVCRVDPGTTFEAHVAGVRNACSTAVRNAYLAEDDLAERIDGFGAALSAPGVDYLQLHVDLVDEALPGVGSSEDSTERSDHVTELGPFTPSGDLTCTTLRFQLSPARTRLRTFFGGPQGGLPAAAELIDAAVALLGQVARTPETTLARLR
ncbi:condensation domain-containing protein [Actinosynnema sp. NPDC023658]|uniref:condensation domain-containing protein n=1 Tax=Actinosynnema sp. NPDC023658 TaxID=3155465 RepID=UPI0034080191